MRWGWSEEYSAPDVSNGFYLRHIQEILGHESSKTTDIYAKITNKGWNKIKKPLDDLEI